MNPPGWRSLRRWSPRVCLDGARGFYNTHRETPCNGEKNGACSNTCGLNAKIINKHETPGAAWLIDPFGSSDVGSPYADRLTLFNSQSDAVGAYKATAQPTSIAVGWQQGDHIKNSAPGSGANPGWVCIATSAPGGTPAFQKEAALTP